MKTLKEFEYDLWTTEEDSVKHYWTRVKATGEVSEVTHEVMKFLRSEEKRMWREIESEEKRGGADLHLETLPADDEGESWIRDPASMEENVLHKLSVQVFRNLLTQNQLEVLDDCLLAGISIREYAMQNNRNHKSVLETVSAIRRKYKNFFV